MDREPLEAPHEGVHGLVCVDKPSGPTSYRVLRDVQRRLGAKKAGHAGTLDPLASGLLVMLLGEATKLSRWVMGKDKSYLAHISFGQATDTLDSLGKVVETAVVGPDVLTEESVGDVLAHFRGTFQQIPPIYSALKRDGRTLMSRARAGEDVEEPAPRSVICQDLQLMEVNNNVAVIRIRCEKGFYVRSLARDIGLRLGIPAHLSWLRRETVGPWSLEHSQAPEHIGMTDVLPLANALPEMQKVILPDRDVTAIQHGQQVQIECEVEEAMLLTPEGHVLAIARHQADGWWRVVRGFKHPSK